MELKNASKSSESSVLLDLLPLLNQGLALLRLHLALHGPSPLADIEGWTYGWLGRAGPVGSPTSGASPSQRGDKNEKMIA